MEKELQKEFSTKFIKDLKSDAYRHIANAAFDETKIPAVKKLQDVKLIELNGNDGLKDKLTALQAKHMEAKKKMEEMPGGKDGYEMRKPLIAEMRELEKEIKNAEIDVAKAESFVVDCDDAIQTINKGVQDAKQKAGQFLDRAKFLETYVWEETKVEEVKPAEEAK